MCVQRRTRRQQHRQHGGGRTARVLYGRSTTHGYAELTTQIANGRLTGWDFGTADKAPLSKVILGTVGASTVLASLMNWKQWLPLQLERVLEDGQVCGCASNDNVIVNCGS